MLIFPKPQTLNKDETQQKKFKTRSLHFLDKTKCAATKNTISMICKQLANMQFVVHEEATAETSIALYMNPHMFQKAQSYSLYVEEQICLVASCDAGLYYGLCSLVQLLQYATTNNDTLPFVKVLDYPSIVNRGIMLDVSRDKVHSMETLYHLADLFSSWKINQIQLYIEHTFAYKQKSEATLGIEKSWAESSPYTAEEMSQFSAYCKQRFIKLIPNQNSFGHLHRILKHEPLNRLAEVPQGVFHGFVFDKEPYSLCPSDPLAVQFLEDLFDQMLPAFESNDDDMLNVGMDETFDLGAGRSKEECAKIGVKNVYMNFLKTVHGLCEKRGKLMMFWGDIILNHPEMIKYLPKNTIPMLWGYEHWAEFEQWSKQFSEHGLNFYVCPGTSSWNSIGGRTQNAIRNIANAAVSGSKHANCIGLLCTDWGDHGHWQPLPVSYLGFLATALFSWNAETAQDYYKQSEQECRTLFTSLLNTLVFKQTPVAYTYGELAYDVGNIYLETKTLHANATIYFRILNRNPHSTEASLYKNYIQTGADSTEGLTVPLIQHTRGHILQLQQKVAPYASMQRDDAKLIHSEYTWVMEMILFALDLAESLLCKSTDYSFAHLSNKNDLFACYAQLKERLPALWLARARPGGLQDSVARFDAILHLLK